MSVKTVSSTSVKGVYASVVLKMFLFSCTKCLQAIIMYVFDCRNTYRQIYQRKEADCFRLFSKTLIVSVLRSF